MVSAPSTLPYWPVTPKLLPPSPLMPRKRTLWLVPPPVINHVVHHQTAQAASQLFHLLRLTHTATSRASGCTAQQHWMAGPPDGLRTRKPKGAVLTDGRGEAGTSIVRVKLAEHAGDNHGLPTQSHSQPQTQGRSFGTQKGKSGRQHSPTAIYITPKGWQ